MGKPRGAHFHVVELTLTVFCKTEDCNKIQEVCDRLSKEVREDVEICFEGVRTAAALGVTGSHVTEKDVPPDVWEAMTSPDDDN